MSEEVYGQLCEAMARRGGRYPGRDIPEFYALAKELFTPEEARVAAAMPRGFSTAEAVAQELGGDAQEVENLLEAMADKGLCSSHDRDGTRYYGAPPFVPGIFEYQFMRGTSTERDRRLARLIHAYKTAFDAVAGPPQGRYPVERVITIDRVVKPGNKVHTYHQVASYIDHYDPIAVSTCFCRHEGKLLDEKDDCGKPDDVCMQFGLGAQFVIQRGMGRKVTKEEAREVLRRSEEAGLVHCSSNLQEGIEFICNCCACHCMILRTALSQPKPGLALYSGFQPLFDPQRCAACETCIQACPGSALTMGEDEVPEVDLDRCFGCGVCATGCPSEAIAMVERPEVPAPPVDRRALKEAIKQSRVS